MGYRLAAVYGGDGSLEKGAAAMARSMVAVNDISVTEIQIINPAPASFEQHGVSTEDGRPFEYIGYVDAGLYNMSKETRYTWTDTLLFYDPESKITLTTFDWT